MSIKSNVLSGEEDGSREFDISDQDLAFIQLMQNAALDMYNYHRTMVQRYLAIMARDDWDYSPDEVLDFEIDPKAKKVKVTPAKKPS